MKVYLEFDLQDPEQLDQHYCALKGQAYRVIIRNLIAELEEDAKEGHLRDAKDWIDLVHGLSAGLGVVIGK